MAVPFTKHLKALSQFVHRKDAESNKTRYNRLVRVHKSPLSKSKQLIDYFDYLLFLQAYPSTENELQLTKKELLRIARLLKKHKTKVRKWLQNSGLPFGTITTQFSHDCIRWLIGHPHCKIEIDSFAQDGIKLYEALNITLPSTEKHIASTGMDHDELMDALLVPKAKRLEFIVNEFARLDLSPQVKDTLFDKIGMFVTISSKGSGISKSTNILPPKEVYYHKELLKRFDHEQLIHSQLPPPRKLTKAQRSSAIEVVKNTMLLTGRETDPTTYMQEDSFKLYALERGVSIAIYGIKAERQLPLESYVGYTVFKNGIPVSYGGAWVFGERANFGINVFEPFRNGESGYLLAQLLRVYINAFKLSYIEVEPYQYGLDNPEGIQSGAFWFYYKYGFRPVDKELNKRASEEYIRIKKKKGYRTSHATLLSFTESNICLKLSRKTPPSVPSITSKITKMMQKSFGGNRVLAESASIKAFKSQTGLKRVSTNEQFALTEIALWARASNIRDRNKLKLMAQMVSAKSKDMFAYQGLLLKFLAK